MQVKEIFEIIQIETKDFTANGICCNDIKLGQYNPFVIREYTFPLLYFPLLSANIFLIDFAIEFVLSCLWGRGRGRCGSGCG